MFLPEEFLRILAPGLLFISFVILTCCLLWQLLLLGAYIEVPILTSLTLTFLMAQKNSLTGEWAISHLKHWEKL